MTTRLGPRKSLPLCFRPISQHPGARLESQTPVPEFEYPPQAQPHSFLTPQTQKVRQPTVEEVAVPCFRAKTTNMSRAWVSPSILEPKSPILAISSPFVLLSQTPPLIEIPISQTPCKSNEATSPPTTPRRRYTPQVTDFALPRHRRYRLSLQWKPQPWDEEDPKMRLQEIFPISSRARGNPRSSPWPRYAGASRRRKLIYSLEELAEHPRRGGRYTDGIVDTINTERAEEIL